MPITKEQASDLKSLQERKVQTALSLQTAQFVDDDAQRKLDSLMWRLEHEAE